MAIRLRLGWLPAIITVLATGWTLTRFEVEVGQVTRYGLWLVLGIALPGTLLWRSLRGTPRSFVEDVAAGSALGFAAEIGVYVLLRAAGHPQLILAWPVLVVAVFAAVPPLWRHWRPAYPERAPWYFGWGLAVLYGLVVFWLTAVYYRSHPLSGPVAAYPYVDLPFQLAMAAEARNHAPPTRSYLLGEPLNYHWFPAAELAGSSWATDLDLRVLLLRLEPLPFMALTLVLTAVLAVRLSGRWWPGPVAAAIAFFGTPLAPYRWAPGNALVDGRLEQIYHVLSPTQLVAFGLFAPVPLLLLDRLHRGPPDADPPSRTEQRRRKLAGRRVAAGQWVLIVVLLTAVAGAKPTYLPLLVAGLVTAAGVQLVLRRRVRPPILVALGVAGVLFAIASLTLYAGDSYGMRLDPGQTVAGLRAVRLTGLDAGATLAITGLALAALLIPAIGATGLARAGDRLFAVLLAGMVAAAVAIVFLYDHPGGSQYYFLYSAYPMLAVLAAAGLGAVLGKKRQWWPVLPALLAGAVLACLVTRYGVDSPPASLAGLVRPVLFVAAVLAGLGLLLGLLRQRVYALRGVTLVVVFAAAIGVGFAGAAFEYRGITEVLGTWGYRPHPLPTDGWPIGDDALASARWLRDHSSPTDIVATNAHCRRTITVPRGAGAPDRLCDNRHFWIAAYTERRVLVESWGYTARTLTGDAPRFAGFNDPELLATNDAAFLRPSAATVGVLRDRYDVRWLFVDARFDPVSPALGRFAVLRHRDGPFAVYEVR